MRRWPLGRSALCKAALAEREFTEKNFLSLWNVVLAYLDTVDEFVGPGIRAWNDLAHAAVGSFLKVSPHLHGDARHSACLALLETGWRLTEPRSLPLLFTQLSLHGIVA